MSKNNIYDDSIDKYIFPAFPFEVPVYLYTLAILVMLLPFVNVIVIIVLLSKTMRNTTNMILSAIAIADTLTGLVALPSYIVVYTRKYVPKSNFYDDIRGNFQRQATNYDQFSNQTNHTPNNVYAMYYDTDSPDYGFIVSENLCNWFMISRHILSKSFYTMSCFLTLFLSVQRYMSVAYPFKYQFLFTERKTLIWCGVICAMSPLLHSYYFGSTKAKDGICKWEFKEHGCGSRCIDLWVAFFLHHLIPCIILLVFTVLFIQHLRNYGRKLILMKNTAISLTKRLVENRRISLIVTAVVIAYLIPKIPYSLFLLYNAIGMTKGHEINLKSNRVIHITYEFLLVISFHAHFYIYILLNRKFRKCLYDLFIKPVQRYFRNCLELLRR